MKTYDQCLACFERQTADACSIVQLGSQQKESILTKVKCETIRRDIGHALGSNVIKIVGV